MEIVNYSSLNFSLLYSPTHPKLLDPALNWSADDLHHETLPTSVREKLTEPATLLRAAKPVAKLPRAKLSNLSQVPLLILYSQEWLEAPSPIPHQMAELMHHGHFGATGSRIVALRGCTHVSYTDACALLPHVVGRAMNMVRRNMPPERVLDNIRLLTLEFLDRHLAPTAVIENAVAARPSLQDDLIEIERQPVQ